MTAEEWAAEIMTWGYEGEPHHLVSILRNVIAEENEACAKLLDDCAKAIRARSSEPKATAPSKPPDYPGWPETLDDISGMPPKFRQP